MNAVVIKDFLRRYGLGIFTCWIFYVLICLIVEPQSAAIIWAFFYAGVGLFSFFVEMVRAHERVPATIATMPIGKRALARSWFFVGCVLPIFLYGIGFGFACLVGQHEITSCRMVALLACQAVLIGSGFWVLTYVRNSHLVVRILVFLIPTIALLVVTVLSHEQIHAYIPGEWSDISPCFVLAIGVGAVLTVAGFFRCEALIKSPPNRVGSLTQQGRVDNTERTWIGFGGWLYAVLYLSNAIAIIGLIVTVFLTLFVDYSGFNPNESSRTFRILGMVFALVFGLQLIPLTRSLRSLPISRGRLSFFLAAFPILFSFCFVCLLQYFFLKFTGGHQQSWETLEKIFFMCAACGFAAPGCLRFGLKSFPLIVGTFLFCTMQFLSGGFWEIEVELPIKGTLAVIGVLLLTLAWLLTYLQLGRSHPWRQDALLPMAMANR